MSLGMMIIVCPLISSYYDEIYVVHMLRLKVKRGLNSFVLFIFSFGSRYILFAVRMEHFFFYNLWHFFII